MLNQANLIGRLTADPEAGKTPNGTDKTTFRLAVNRSYTNGSGERVEKTTFFRITCWRELAKQVSGYLTKGRLVCVQGEIEPAQAYINREGDPTASNEVTAYTVLFLDGAQKSDTTATAKDDATANLPF